MCLCIYKWSFLSVDVGFDFGVAFDLTELLFPASMVFVIKTPEISVLFFSLLDISFWRWCSLIKLAVPVLEALIWVLVWAFSCDVLLCVNASLMPALAWWWFCFDWFWLVVESVVSLFVTEALTLCLSIISKIHKLVIPIHTRKVLKCILKDKRKNTATD